MFKDTKAFSGFSVNDLAVAKEFYGQTLGIDIEEIPEGLLLKIAGSNGILCTKRRIIHLPPIQFLIFL